MHGDRAQEVTGALISAWANARGVHVTRTVAKNPQTNGIAERAIAILKQEARKLLLTTSAAPSSVLWPFAVLRASTLQRYRRLHLVSSDVAFGSSIVVLQREGLHGENMWDARTEPAIALGSDEDSRGGGHFVWNLARQHVQVHRNIKEVTEPHTVTPASSSIPVPLPDVFGEVREQEEHDHLCRRQRQLRQLGQLPRHQHR